MKCSETLFSKRQMMNAYHDFAKGLLCAHSRLNANTSKTLESASFLYALVELLSEKGLITIDELDERKKVVGQRLVEQFKREGSGVMLQDPEYDKYAFEADAKVNCEGHIHLCQAACCRLPFALSKQDIQEGLVHWDFGQPYMIDQGEDGYCNHLERETHQCSIYPNRPVPCHGYDCRKDKHIWLDFENRLINPEIHLPNWPHYLVTEEKQSESQPILEIERDVQSSIVSANQ
jgi:Fe-S-cluster containining protein